MTPGEYIRLRREAAGLSIGDVMALLGGGGMLSAPIDEIERGIAQPTGFDGALLAWAIPIDDRLLDRLKHGEPVQLCAGCGCSHGHECRHGDFGTCTLDGALCSVCAWEAAVARRSEAAA